MKQRGWKRVAIEVLPWLFYLLVALVLPRAA
jgi:hypothetical protein